MNNFIKSSNLKKQNELKPQKTNRNHNVVGYLISVYEVSHCAALGFDTWSPIPIAKHTIQTCSF